MARRKVETLLRYGADVRVVSPQVCPEIESLLSGACGGPLEAADLEGHRSGQEAAGPGKASEKIRQLVPTPEILEEEISGAALAVAASASRQTNHLTARISCRLGVPVNVADQPSECTFFFPAVVKKDEISIGISTGGLSPIVSSRIRQEMEETIPDYYADIACQLGQIRTSIRERISGEKDRRACLKAAAARAFRLKRALSEEEIRDIEDSILS